MGLGESVRKGSLQYPDKTAIIFGEQSWTYGQFDEITDRLAASLIQLGIHIGDRVAIHLSNSAEIVFCYYACFKIGAVAVPLNNRLKAQELEYIINHSGTKICISQADLFSEIQQVRTALPNIQRYYLLGNTTFPDVHDFAELLEQSATEITLPTVNQDAVAVILYTSGTTARPKGVTHTHHSLELTARYHIEQVKLSDKDITGIMLPLCHIFGFSLQLLTSVIAGASMVIIPRFEPGLVLQTLQQQRVTRLHGLPVMYNALVNYPNADAYDCSLQVCFAGGDAVPVTLQQRFEEIFGVELMEGCGMTEVIPYSLNPHTGEKRVGSIGKVATGMTLRLVDEQGKDVSQGEVGEVLVNSEAMMIGYWNNPEVTAATLQNGWLHTGDLAWMDEDEYYWFTSRKKEMIIRGGSNISPLEVEAVLYQHPAIKEAAVIGLPDPNWGQSVQAFVVLLDGYSLTEGELLDFVRERIAAYKVPETIVFLPELPKGLTGKIHRKTLKDFATVKVRL